MILTLIAAVAENGVIGERGRIPWDCPADRARFREVTWGHPLILGRRTWEGLGTPLPGREVVVLSRDPEFRDQRCRVARSLEEALEPYRGSPSEVFVGGGALVYSLALPAADRLLLTRVPGEYPGDAAFPEVDWDQWVRAAVEVLPGAPPCAVEGWRRRA